MGRQKSNFWLGLSVAFFGSTKATAFLRKQNFIRKIFSSQVLDLKRESIAKSVCNILGIIKNYALFFLLLSQYPKVKKNP